MHQAFYSMSRRGHNVDMMTVYKGPGGVGLSLLSAHINAMGGDRNHKLFDPNVFVMDEDLKNA